MIIARWKEGEVQDDILVETAREDIGAKRMNSDEEQQDARQPRRQIECGLVRAAATAPSALRLRWRLLPDLVPWLLHLFRPHVRFTSDPSAAAAIAASPDRFAAQP